MISAKLVGKTLHICTPQVEREFTATYVVTRYVAPDALYVRVADTHRRAIATSARVIQDWIATGLVRVSDGTPR